MSDTTHILCQKLHDRLKISGWADVLKSFTLSEQFSTIISKLEEEVADGKRFTPPLKQVFSAFENCPVPELKAVIVCTEPYHYFGYADGMALSMSNLNRLTPELAHLFKSAGLPLDREVNLKRWAEQGVLLLNTALTTTIDKPRRHLELWEPFTAFLVDMLNKRDDLVWAILGRENWTLDHIINPEQSVLFFEQLPTLQEAVYTGQPLQLINLALQERGKSPVNW